MTGWYPMDGMFPGDGDIDNETGDDMSQEYSTSNDNEGSNVPRIPKTTPLDEIAGRRVQPNSALAMGRIVRALVLEGTDMQAEPTLVAAPVTLIAGTTTVTVVTAVDGTQYEVFVRERR